MHPFTRFLTLLIVAGCLLSACSRSSTPEPVNIPPGGADVVNVYTNQSGLTAIRSTELTAAGMKSLPPEQYQLLKGDTPIPFWVQLGKDSTDFTLWFYAQANTVRYSAEQVYQLKAGSGSLTQFAAALSTSPAVPLDQADGSLRREENTVYVAQAVGGKTPWFWQLVRAPQKADFSFSWERSAPGMAHLTLQIWSGTSAPADPDHSMRVLVNGTLVLEKQWENSGWQTFDVDMPDGTVRNGENTLTLEAAALPDVVVQNIYLDEFTIRAPQVLQVEQGTLEFTGSGSALAVESKNTPALIWDITDPFQPVSVAGFADGSTLIFSTESGHVYAAVNPDKPLKPARLAPADWTPDLRAAQGADYLAIGAPELLTELKPLLDFRAGQGMKTAAVSLQTIYDQFNGGNVDPLAVQTFLRYAAQNWQPAPRYVLLAGDTSYDMLGYQTPVNSLELPTFYVDTEYGGETASDVPFARLDDDLLPDIAVGRLPAVSADQMRIAVNKILAYEKATLPGLSSLSVLAIADGQEASFGSEAQAFLDLFPETYPRTLFAPPKDSINLNTQVADYLNQGQYLVAYFGHGSTNMWGKDKFFTVDDVNLLKNKGKLPIVVNMTCLAGFFIHPKITSLAETLLFTPDTGAVTVLAPTSLSLPNGQKPLSDAFARALIAPEQTRIGDVLLSAQRGMSVDSSVTIDVLQTFLLLGDPALTVKKLPAQ